MSGRRTSILSEENGSTLVEFALTAPIVLTLIIGILQLSTLFFANAGLEHAVESGARYATIYPRPSDAAIIAKVNASQYGLLASQVTGPTLSRGTTSGASYVDVTMSYAVPINFIFFRTGAINLSYTRRAYQP